MGPGQIVVLLGGQTILLAAVGWLIRTLIDHSLVKDVNKFKQQLQRESDAFKSQLEIDAHRQITVFAQLHTQRNVAIAEVYALLASAEQAVAAMVAPFQPVGAPDGAAHMNKSAIAIEAFRDKFAANRIWFTRPTCEKADAVLAELRGIHNHFNIVARGGTGKPEHVNTEEWSKSWARVEQQLPGLRAALELDFRSILGVDKN